MLSIIKKFVKRILPESAQKHIAYNINYIKNFNLFKYDQRRYKKHYSKRIGSGKTSRQLLARIIFSTHAIEKGLSHENFRYGFGKRALSNLANDMKCYDVKNYDKNNDAYISALSAVGEYIKRHKEADFDLEYLEKIFGNELITEIKNNKVIIGGSTTVLGSSKFNNKNANFKELFNNRYSIRAYSKKKLDKKLIDSSIELSMKSPSVCNRQSSRTYVIYNKEKIKQVMNIQKGMTGYEMPPVLIITTSDCSSFVEITERNQSYIDGGMFSMSLLLSLEYYGLAACPLNAMFGVRIDKLLRKIVGIGDSENIIMLIAVGNFKEKNLIPKSFRYKAKDITNTLE